MITTVDRLAGSATDPLVPIDTLSSPQLSLLVSSVRAELTQKVRPVVEATVNGSVMR